MTPEENERAEQREHDWIGAWGNEHSHAVEWRQRAQGDEQCIAELRAQLARVEAERDVARENSLRRLEANIDLRARAETAEADRDVWRERAWLMLDRLRSAAR